MTHAIILNNQITTHGDYRTLWPNTSFSALGPNAEFLAENNAVAIRSDPPHDPETQILQPCEPYLLNGVAYNMETVDRSPAIEPTPEPQWIQFGLELAGVPAIHELLGTVESVNRPLERMLSGGLLQAAEGNPRTFLAAWAKVAELGLVSSELIPAITALAATHGLPAEFIAGLDA
jgi:hypothetical protein